MLGKHVNVSARNQKLFKKVFCVFMAIVLVGLMVPHGLAAQLNAYAKSAEQTPAAETQADNPQESTPAEEVNSNNNAQSNEGEPVAEPVANYTWSVTLTLSDGTGLYLDNENGDVATSIPSPWEITGEDSDSHVTELKATGTSETTEAAPTYKSLLDSISLYCYGGDEQELAKGLPSGCFLGDFVYKNDRQGIHLEEHVAEGDHPAEPFITTNIVINNTAMTPVDTDPQLWYFIGSKSYVQRESWPTDTKVDYLEYNTSYTIDTTNKLLKVTAASEYGAHKVGAFTAKLVSDVYDSDGFTTDDTTGTISPNLTFTAHWTLKDLNFSFCCESGYAGSYNYVDAKFKVNGIEQTGEGPYWNATVPQPAYFINNNGVLEFYSAAEGGEPVKTITFDIDPSEPYSLVKWEAEEADGSGYDTVPTDHREFFDEYSYGGLFSAVCNQDVIIDYDAYKRGTTEAIEGLTLQKSNNGTTWQTVTASERFSEDALIYYDNSTKLLHIGEWMYRYVFPTGEEVKYIFEGWFNVVTDPSESHTPITETTPGVALKTLGYNLNIASEYTENSAISFSINPTTSQAKVMTAKASSPTQWTEVTAQLYYGDGYAYRKHVDNDVTYLQIGILDAAMNFMPVDLFQIQNPTTGYKFGKWAVGATEVVTEPVSITDDVAFTANMQIALTFVMSPVLTPEPVGHVVDENGEEVTEAWAYPGADITYNEEVATIDGLDYTAVCDNPAYEFGNWPTTEVVPDEPGNFTVTFKKMSDVTFTIDVLDDFKEGITITEAYGGTSHTVAPGTTEYFTEGSKYWKSADGKQLIIGTDTATAATQHVFTVTLTNEHTHYNKWMVDNAEVPLAASAIELTIEDHAAKLYIDVDAQVKFAISSPEGATDDNCLINRNGTKITDFTLTYFYAPTTFVLDGKTLNIALLDGTADVYFTDSDEHFQKFEKWVDEAGEDVTSGNLEYNQSYTFVAKFVELDPLTTHGYCFEYGTSPEVKLAGSGYADVYFIDKTSYIDVAFYKSYPITSTIADGFTLSDLPNNIHIYVNAAVPGWITEDEDQFAYEENPNQPIKVEFETNGALQFDKNGVSTDATTWTGTYGKKFDMTGVTKTEGGISVTPSSTMTTTIKNHDKINLVDFTNYGDFDTPEVTASLKYTNQSSQQITKTFVFKRQVFFDLTDTEDIAGSTQATITFTGFATASKNITNIDVHNSARTVSFTLDNSSKLGTFVDQNDVKVETISVGSGATFHRTTTGDNKNQVAIKDADGTSIKTVSPKGSEIAGSETIFRAWTDTLTSDEDVVIVEDVTFVGKFVDKFLNVNFQPDTNSKSGVTVTGDGTGTSTVKVYNDSWFDPYDKSRTQKTGKTVTASFKYSETEFNNYVLTMDDASAVYYKFADLAFTYPTLPAGQETVQVNESMLDENNILVVTYMVVDKVKCKLTANLDGGALASGVSFPAVPETLGGHQAWTAEADGTYTNTFFEETTRELIDNTYMLHGKMDIIRTEGFFSGNWQHTTSTPDWITTDETWTAIYDASALVTGKVETSEATPQPAVDVIVELYNSENEDPIAPDVHSVKGTTDASGNYSLKVYAYEKYSHYITGTMTAGSKVYIEKDTELTDSDWTSHTAATQNFTGDLALDKGYSFFAEDYTQYGNWYARYYDKVSSSPNIGTTELRSPVDGEVSIGSGTWLYFDLSSFRKDSGDEIIITTSTASGHFRVNTENICKEDAEITSNRFVYTWWYSKVDINLTNGPGEGAKKVSRIDYRMPWEDYISIHGKVTEKDTSSALDGINVTYTAPAGSNALVTSKTTFDGGNYYLIIPKGAAGKVMFVDPWNDHEKDDHLDERIRLADDGSDTQSDITDRHTPASGDVANPEMIPAIHIEGNVEKIISAKGEEPVEYGPAEGALVSYSEAHDPGEGYNYEWNEDNHGYAVTDSNGNYVLKLKKSDTEGGFVWFSLPSSGDIKYAQDGHKLMKNGVLLPHNEDIDEINGHIDYLGSYVQITADEWTTINHFDIITYYEGTEIDRYESDETIDTKGLFSDQGKFRTGYDEEGEHVLEYYVGSPDDFRISVKPILNEGSTYWAWKLRDCEDPTKVTTLNDASEVELEVTENEVPYIFTLYTTDSAVLTANGTSEGHAMWDVNVTVTSGTLDPVTENLQVPAGTDFVREFPICHPLDVNKVDEEIHTEYYFDGENFNLVISSAFDDDVPYEEHWVLDPVAAEGYYFVGMSMNNADMVAGDITELSDNNALNLVAHYAPIPEEVNAQTGDGNSMFWLVGLAILAMVGVAYGASRKQKGIRC